MNEPEKTKNHTCPTALLSLDEAIAHAEECADNTPCGRNHRQLAEWLKELRELRQGNAAAMREALEFVAHMYDSPYTTYDVLVAVQKAKAALSATPHKGKWKNGRRYEYAYCSECGRMQWAGWDTHKQAEENIESFACYYKYCPGCGAEMEGGVYVK